MTATPTTRIAIGTPVMTRTGAVGVVTAHSTADVGRVEVRQYHRGWQRWLQGCWYDVEALVVLHGATVAEGEAA